MSNSPTRSKHFSIAIVFYLLASFGAGFLLYSALKNGPVAGCGAGSSCDDVLKSRWAYVLPGIPVTAPALFTYLLLLFGLIFKPRSEVWSGALFIGALTVIGAAVWFVGLQVFVIKSFCIYCMGTHALGVIGSICVLLGLKSMPREVKMLAAGGAAMSLAALAACQIILPQLTTADSRVAGGGVSGSGEVVEVGGMKFDLGMIPHYGNADSAKRMVLLFDYTCGSCRKVHGYMDRAAERFGQENYLVVMLPTPLNPDCNRHLKKEMPDHRDACLFASMAFAIWSVDPEKFYEYDAWMIENGSARYAPDAASARAKAEELIGAEALTAGLANPQVTENLERTTKLWSVLRETSGMTMPKMVWSNGTATTGAPGSEFQLFDLLKEKLGLVRKAE